MVAATPAVPTSPHHERTLPGVSRTAPAVRTRWLRWIAVVLVALSLPLLAFTWFSAAQAIDDGIACARIERPDECVLLLVDPSGPADRAGLRVGDLLLAVDGVPVSDRPATMAL